MWILDGSWRLSESQITRITQITQILDRSWQLAVSGWQESGSGDPSYRRTE